MSISLSSGRHSTGRVRSDTAITSTERGKMSAGCRIAARTECPSIGELGDQGTANKARCAGDKDARHDLLRLGRSFRVNLPGFWMIVQWRSTNVRFRG